jgi:hypothetical protein
MMGVDLRSAAGEEEVFSQARHERFRDSDAYEAL